MPKVKICGITQPQQGREISSFGADYLGVVLYPKSPRNVSLDKVKKIKESITGETELVAVVVNPEVQTVKELLEVVDLVQFHGDEPLEFVRQFPKDRVIKAFRIKQEEEIKKLKPFIDEGYTVLVDAYVEGQYGGTGSRLDLNLLKKIPHLQDRVIVAGGLSEDNVGELLEVIKPFGVDASSKLEISPGLKDLQKVKKFIKAVKG